MKYLALALALAALGAVSAAAQPITKPFVHDLSPLKTLNGNNLFTPEANPIKPENAVSAKGAAFVETASGKRIKFLGVSLQNAACFPDSADAEALTAHLKSIGFNALRLAKFDNPAWGSYGSIFADENSTDHFGQEQLDKFDNLVAKAAKNGLYIALQLYGEWAPRSGDVIAPAMDSADLNARYVFWFVPEYREKILENAKRLLTRKNKYTNTALAQEPALAYIELANENSLFEAWRNGRLSHRGGVLSYTQNKMLDSLYRAFLANKYTTDANLVKAWSNIPESTDNILANGDFEDNLDPLDHWQMSVNTDNNAAAVLYPSNGTKHSGNNAAWLRITKKGINIFDALLTNRSIKVKKGQIYRATFWARGGDATPNYRLAAALQRGAPPYENYGYNIGVSSPFQLTKDWAQYSVLFRCSETDDATAMLAFYCGFEVGDWYLDDFTIEPVPETGLDAGESLQTTINRTPTVAQLNGRSPARARDETEFYTSLVQQTINRVLQALRVEAQCSKPILAGFAPYSASEAKAFEAFDATSAAGGWDYVLWENNEPVRIDNLGFLDNDYGGPLAGLTRGARTNKPHIINEFMSPQPSAHLADMTTMLPAFAAYQDWDGLFIGGYHFLRDRWDEKAFDSSMVYSHRGNAAIMAHIPAANFAFVQSNIQPAQKSIGIHIANQEILAPHQQNAASYFLKNWADSRMVFFRKVRIDSIGAAFSSEQPQNQIAEFNGTLNTANILSDTEELRWNLDKGSLAVEAPDFTAFYGNIAGQIYNVGDLRFAANPGANPAYFSWTKPEQNTAKVLKRSLIALSSRQMNSETKWTNNNIQWKGGWGKAPKIHQAIQAELSIKRAQGLYSAAHLDPDANYDLLTEFDAAQNPTRINIDPDQTQQPSLWTLIINETPSAAETNRPGPRAALHTSPNPAADFVSVEGEFLANHAETIEIADIFGNIVQQTAFERSAPRRAVRLSTAHLPSGVYILSAKGGGHCKTASIAIVR